MEHENSLRSKQWCVSCRLCAGQKKADDIAVAGVAEIPNVIDGRVGNSRFLAGEKLTEADTRLLPTLAQFDAAYHGARKCSRQRIVNFPHLTLLWVGFCGK